jgi:predicted cobalt transporter CbtA
MKYILAPILAFALCLQGCATFNPTDAQISTATSVATATGLRLVNLPNRAKIANYVVLYVATPLKSITGDPTPEELTNLLVGAIPSNIKSDYPELVAFVVPIVISNYQLLYNKYANDTAKIKQVLNDIAYGLESGAAPFRS